MTFLGVSKATLGSWEVFSQRASDATPMPAPIEVPTNVFVSSMSENAVAPAGNKDRVWDFSADLYCRNEADWEIYLIENP